MSFKKEDVISKVVSVVVLTVLIELVDWFIIFDQPVKDALLKMVGF